MSLPLIHHLFLTRSPPAPSTMPPKFHPDFKSSTGIVLQLSDGICFAFNGHILASFSPFFAAPVNVAGTKGTAKQPILTGVGSDALVLALSLLQGAVTYRLPPPATKWPSTDILSDLLKLVDAYGLYFVADALLIRTKSATPSDVFERYAFDRYAFACATKSPFAEDELHATMKHNCDHASEWAKAVLSQHGQLADLYKAHLDHTRLTVADLKRKCSIPSPPSPQRKRIKPAGMVPE